MSLRFAKFKKPTNDRWNGRSFAKAAGRGLAIGSRSTSSKKGSSKRFDAAAGKSAGEAGAGKSPAVERWLAANGESVRGVKPSPLPDQPWGFCTFRPAEGGREAKLYLHVFDWHASGQLVVYGLTGGGPA